MKKTILAPVLALAMSAAAVTPALATPYSGTIATPNIFSVLIGLLLPAVQKSY